MKAVHYQHAHKQFNFFRQALFPVMHYFLTLNKSDTGYRTLIIFGRFILTAELRKIFKNSSENVTKSRYSADTCGDTSRTGSQQCKETI